MARRVSIRACSGRIRDERPECMPCVLGWTGVSRGVRPRGRSGRTRSLFFCGVLPSSITFAPGSSASPCTPLGESSRLGLLRRSSASACRSWRISVWRSERRAFFDSSSYEMTRYSICVASRSREEPLEAEFEAAKGGEEEKSVSRGSSAFAERSTVNHQVRPISSACAQEK